MTTHVCLEKIEDLTHYVPCSEQITNKHCGLWFVYNASRAYLRFATDMEVVERPRSVILYFYNQQLAGAYNSWPTEREATHPCAAEVAMKLWNPVVKNIGDLVHGDIYRRANNEICVRIRWAGPSPDVCLKSHMGNAGKCRRFDEAEVVTKFKNAELSIVQMYELKGS